MRKRPYERLDSATTRNRLGRVTRYFYDPLRRLTATRDPLGRTVTQEWCGCGALDAVIDPSGNRTHWERDAQSRVRREVRADGSAITYTYGTATSRLEQRTDAKGQGAHYKYFLDGQLQQISYSNATIATPTVALTYDAGYGRLSTMTDGIGTTAYTYRPVGQLGAGAVGTVDGPLTADTISYGYDELGRVVSRTLGSVTTTWSYDALDRLLSLADPIGTFTYGYDGETSRVTSLTYPNNQTSPTHICRAPGIAGCRTSTTRPPAGARSRGLRTRTTRSGTSRRVRSSTRQRLAPTISPMTSPIS